MDAAAGLHAHGGSPLGVIEQRGAARNRPSTRCLNFAISSGSFSPIVDEIFFRGVLQRSLEERLSVNASTSIECAAFGIVHLCHHGLALGAAGVVVRPLSGALWVVLMFLVAWMFAVIRQGSGSLFPAMASHAAFNATMNSVIFTFLWKWREPSGRERTSARAQIILLRCFL